LRKSSIFYVLSKDLPLELIDLLEYFCVIYSVSNLIFVYILNKELHPLPFIGCGLGILNAALPMQKINKYLFPLKKSTDTV